MKTWTPSVWPLLVVLALGAGARGWAAPPEPDKPSPAGSPLSVLPAADGPPASSKGPPLIELPGPVLPTAPTSPAKPVTEAAHADDAGNAPGAFFVEADYLLMTPRLRPLDYAITGFNTGYGPAGDVRSINWLPSSGFRIGGGYRLPGDCWEVAGFYTYLSSSRTQGAGSPAGGALFATLTTPGLVELASTAFANSNFDYNVFDLEAARRFQAGASTTYRLFGGVRFADISQGIGATYDGIDASNDRVTSRTTFDGGGVRVGAEGIWNVIGGLGLYARGSGSMLVGQSSSHLTETANGGSVLITSLNDRFVKVVPVAQLGLGVSWTGRGWRLSAGYEFVNWFGLVDVPDVVNDVDHGKITRRVGDLSLDGLVLRAELSY